MEKRPNKDEYYLRIAEAVLQRSTCLLRKYGAIIVKNDAIVSTGYNGPARGVKNCDEFGFCLRELINAPKGHGYEYCPAVHAEENAIINAARLGASILGGKLYLVGKEVKTGKYTEAMPCERCRRAIINAGIVEVILRNADGSIKKINPKIWIEEDTKNYLEKARRFKPAFNKNE
ncbi:MAG: cytidine deaminase [Candidatus Methanomethylicota archaeon]|nr:MAG: cytidine deaminase [Candidatus Verstraetearchaeota archaeon]